MGRAYGMVRCWTRRSKYMTFAVKSKVVKRQLHILPAILATIRFTARGTPQLQRESRERLRNYPLRGVVWLHYGQLAEHNAGARVPLVRLTDGIHRIKLCLVTGHWQKRYIGYAGGVQLEHIATKTLPKHCRICCLFTQPLLRKVKFLTT